jgi:hypothetical protein
LLEIHSIVLLGVQGLLAAGSERERERERERCKLGFWFRLLEEATTMGKPIINLSSLPLQKKKKQDAAAFSFEGPLDPSSSSWLHELVPKAAAAAPLTSQNPRTKYGEEEEEEAAAAGRGRGVSVSGSGSGSGVSVMGKSTKVQIQWRERRRRRRRKGEEASPLATVSLSVAKSLKALQAGAVWAVVCGFVTESNRRLNHAIRSVLAPEFHPSEEYLSLIGL